MAMTTLAVSLVAASTARKHAALTDEFEYANAGSWNVERVNGLIYAIEAEARAVYLAADRDAAEKPIAALNAFNDKIGAVLADWQINVKNADAAKFSEFSVRVAAFQQFPAELARIAAADGPEAARSFAQDNDHPDIRNALTEDLAKLSQIYAAKASQIYTQINESIDFTSMWMSVSAALAVMLAVIGVIIIMRSVTKPLARITEVTQTVASGKVDIAVPYDTRQDEIGALARSIAVFQDAMRHNVDLNKTVVADAETRAQRQQQVSTEINRFSADVEATLAELGRIADEMPRNNCRVPRRTLQARRPAPALPRRRLRPMYATSHPRPTSYRRR